MHHLIANIVQQVGSIVIGKEPEIRLSLACLFAKGHILIEDLPGMGKTTLAQVLSKTLGLSYQRTQFTSDMLPSDVVGISIFDTDKNAFTLHKGPIFNQVVLADEINRASPKTQSALLEAMESAHVSIDGKTYALPEPFFVIATQNPLFHSGTYPLPESQLDRFTMRITLGFPSVEAEKRILANSNNREDINNLAACITVEQLMDIQKLIEGIHVSESILEYVIALCQISRKNIGNVNPLSPRAGKALLASAKAWAFMDDRDHVLPQDIQAVFEAVCEHRLDTTGTISTSNEMSAAKNILQQVDPTNPL
ncbi:AAA family ATPase [Pseudocolwellia sp. HL-MZ19]|uniref:AAA family ATPase n=1 Tax=Pseudocolwellia sp. HL-MZ19 TaxID=3400846 RepID=UPI003CF7DAEB